MSSGFLDLITGLAQASSQSEQARLSRTFSRKLAEAPHQGEVTLRNALTRALHQCGTIKELSRDFLVYSHRLYLDDDGLRKFAFGVSFLDDYTQSELRRDERLMGELIEALANVKLELIANDLTVNLLQARNGEPTKSL